MKLIPSPCSLVRERLLYHRPTLTLQDPAQVGPSLFVTVMVMVRVARLTECLDMPSQPLFQTIAHFTISRTGIEAAGIAMSLRFKPSTTLRPSRSTVLKTGSVG